MPIVVGANRTFTIELYRVITSSTCDASNTLTESLTFNGAQAAQLLVKSNTAIVAITGPGAIAGTGDVVITDDLGNTFTLGGSWTYY